MFRLSVDKQLPKWLWAFEIWELISIDFLSVRHPVRLSLIVSLEHQNGSVGVLVFGCKVHQLWEACRTNAKQTPDQTGF